MATALKQHPEVDAQPIVNIESFLRDLGEVSRRHGLGLADGATLYVMEPEDYARAYLADEESAVTFA